MYILQVCLLYKCTCSNRMLNVSVFLVTQGPVCHTGMEEQREALQKTIDNATKVRRLYLRLGYVSSLH